MKETSITITTGTIIRVIVLLASAALLWYLRDLVLIVLTSIVIASSIEPAARVLRKHRVPRVLAVLAVYLSFFATFFAVIFFLLPPVLNETSSLINTVPMYIDTIHTPAGNIDQNTLNHTKTLLSDFSLKDTTNDIANFMKGLSGNFLMAISVIFGGAFSLILIVVFSFYFAINEKGIEEFLRVVTPLQYENYVLDLWRRTKVKIGLWMQGQFLLAILIGVLTYLGLAILGIQYALVLAVIAATMELIPVFGPILASIPAIALAFTGGGITMALIVAAFYIIIQQFENHLIYPLVVTKVVGVPPILVIIALLIGAKVAGILGILLSVPLAAAAQELFNDAEKSRKAH